MDKFLPVTGPSDFQYLLAHKLVKKKKKRKKKFLTKPPQLKLFTSSPPGQANQAMSLPNPRSLYFGLTHQLSPQRQFRL